jgi:hypothetical protein
MEILLRSTTFISKKFSYGEYLTPQNKIIHILWNMTFVVQLTSYQLIYMCKEEITSQMWYA